MSYHILLFLVCVPKKKDAKIKMPNKKSPLNAQRDRWMENERNEWIIKKSCIHENSWFCLFMYILYRSSHTVFKLHNNLIGEYSNGLRMDYTPFVLCFHVYVCVCVCDVFYLIGMELNWIRWYIEFSSSEQWTKSHEYYHFLICACYYGEWIVWQISY